MDFDTATSWGIPEHIFHELTLMPDIKKIKIIQFLAGSLSDHTATVEDEKSCTSRMLEKHAGKWVGDESVDEIMGIIRENSSVREPLAF